MKIIELKIEFSDKNKQAQKRLFTEDFVKTTKYKFEDYTLVTSDNENSKGKTSLIRFLLYAMGYKVSMTDGMKAYNFRTTLKIGFNDKVFYLTRDGEYQFINNEDFSNRTSFDDSSDSIPMINHILGINSPQIIQNLLGCFYIDQEKGWGLTNYGTVLGNNKFNIDRLFIGIKRDEELVELDKNNCKIEKENKKFNLLKDISNLTNTSFTGGTSESPEVLKQIEALNKDRLLLSSEISFYQKEVTNLETLLLDNKNFVENINNFNLIILHKGEEIPVTSKNLIDFKLQQDLLFMKLNGLKSNIEKIASKRKDIDTKIADLKSGLTKQDYVNSLTEVVNQLGSIKIEEYKINAVLDKNKRDKSENNQTISSSTQDLRDEFWMILKPILDKIEISSEYNQEKIVRQELSKGISGTQLHKLSFSFRIALTLFIKKKLNIELPFIVDSPRSGEINEKISSEMLNLCHLYLKSHQIIVSSVYTDYSLNYNFYNLPINNGVVDELEKFK